MCIIITSSILSMACLKRILFFQAFSPHTESCPLNSLFQQQKKRLLIFIKIPVVFTSYAYRYICIFLRKKPFLRFILVFILIFSFWPETLLWTNLHSCKVSLFISCLNILFNKGNTALTEVFFFYYCCCFYLGNKDLF